MRLADRVALLEVVMDPGADPPCTAFNWGPPTPNGRRYRLEEIQCTVDKATIQGSICAHWLNWVEDPLGITASEYAEQIGEPEATIEVLKRMEATYGKPRAGD